MNEKLKVSVWRVLRSVFPSLNGEINEYWGPDDIEEWDSMGHLNMIMALGEEFDVTFDFEEVMAIEKISDIFETIRKKGVE